MYFCVLKVVGLICLVTLCNCIGDNSIGEWCMTYYKFTECHQPVFNIM